MDVKIWKTFINESLIIELSWNIVVKEKCCAMHKSLICRGGVPYFCPIVFKDVWCRFVVKDVWSGFVVCGKLSRNGITTKANKCKDILTKRNLHCITEPFHCSLQLHLQFSLLQPFSTYNKTAADDYENILTKISKVSVNESIMNTWTGGWKDNTYEIDHYEHRSPFVTMF